MYRRLTKEERDDLRNKCYYSDKLFITYVDVLNDIQHMHNELSPEEIWNEARMYVRQLGKAKRPDKEVGSIYNEMVQKYMEFEDETVHKKRSVAESEQTATCVLMCVLSMLCTTETDVNPYHKICGAIGKKVRSHPITREIYEKQRQAEQEEEDDGEIIPFKDYMHEEEAVEMEMIEKRERREKIRKCAKEKLVKAFTSLNISHEDFSTLIDKIFSIDGFMESMEDLEFGGFQEFNRTFFCNLVGALKRGGITSLSYEKLDEGLDFGVMVKSYINGADASKNSKHWKLHRSEIEGIIVKYKNNASKHRPDTDLC